MVVHKYLHPATVAVRVLSLHCNHGVTSRVADAVTDTVMEDGMLAPTREASCPSGQFVRAVQLEVADIPDQLLTSAGGRVGVLHKPQPCTHTINHIIFTQMYPSRWNALMQTLMQTVSMQSLNGFWMPTETTCNMCMILWRIPRVCKT